MSTEIIIKNINYPDVESELLEKLEHKHYEYNQACGKLHAGFREGTISNGDTIKVTITYKPVIDQVIVERVE